MAEIRKNLAEVENKNAANQASEQLSFEHAMAARSTDALSVEELKGVFLSQKQMGIVWKSVLCH